MSKVVKAGGGKSIVGYGKNPNAIIDPAYMALLSGN